MLQIEILEKKYRQSTILEKINLKIEKNGLYGVVGKNGSGKTTFFKCIAHLIDFQGNIILNNHKISSENIAFIPTEPYLYDYLSVGEFYTFYAKLMNISVKKNAIFDLDTSLLIKELSTGMRKKAYINAVFQKNYDIYIFDEPFNGLDIESVYELRKTINQLSENHIVMISSHILESLNNCENIFVLKDKNITTFFPKNYSEIEKMLF